MLWTFMVSGGRMVMYLRVDHADIETWPELAEIIWPGATGIPRVYANRTQFYFVPDTHPGIEFILLRLTNPVWYDQPGVPEVRAFA